MGLCARMADAAAAVACDRHWVHCRVNRIDVLHCRQAFLVACLHGKSCSVTLGSIQYPPRSTDCQHWGSGAIKVCDSRGKVDPSCIPLRLSWLMLKPKVIGAQIDQDCICLVLWLRRLALGRLRTRKPVVGRVGLISRSGQSPVKHCAHGLQVPHHLRDQSHSMQLKSTLLAAAVRAPRPRTPNRLRFSPRHSPGA